MRLLDQNFSQGQYLHEGEGLATERKFGYSAQVSVGSEVAKAIRGDNARCAGGQPRYQRDPARCRSDNTAYRSDSSRCRGSKKSRGSDKSRCRGGKGIDQHDEIHCAGDKPCWRPDTATKIHRCLLKNTRQLALQGRVLMRANSGCEVDNN